MAKKRVELKSGIKEFFLIISVLISMYLNYMVIFEIIELNITIRKIYKLEGVK